MSLGERREGMKYGILSLVLFCLFPAYLWGATETLHLPLVLDYPLIRSFLIQQVYHEPRDRAIPLDQGGGCARIELWEPEVGSEGSLIKIGSRIRIRAGISILGLCLRVTEWEGHIEVLQRVWLDNKTWKVRFETIDSRFYDQERKRISLRAPFVHLIKTYLHPYLDTVAVDLAQPKNEITEFLPLFFPAEERPRIVRWLDSIRPGEVQVGKEAVRINILMEVEVLPEPPKKPEGPLSEQEIEHLTRLWEGWDAFLVYQIESLIGQPLTRDERKSLLELLLSTRSHFAQALKERTLEQDMIREQFVSAWKKLSPILRKYLVRQPSPSLLNLLAFFSVSDTLAVLDKLGPVLNIEINRDGLLRLTRLLLQGDNEVSLEYSRSLDPRLRELLGLGPPPDESGPAFDSEELDFPEEKEKKEKQSGIRPLWRFLIPFAHADEPASTRLAELKEWVPPEQNAGTYLDKVKVILEQAAGDSFLKTQLETDYQALYRNLILATAWQESCWRQFVKSKGKIRYLVSYNQTSVGLMQINERVWRGFYRLESLRWNIRYNIRAGCEILNLYLIEYAIKRSESKGTLDRDTLVQVTYGMYNAGPGEYDEFLKRSKKNAPHRRDKLFWQKYLSSKRDQFDGLLNCLSGE
jgi:Transglycosylase SLT domain